jgi:ABC-type antimicrobial peptide transport system permease subunit
LAATRYVRELLYGVEPMDAVSIFAAVFVILVAAVLATYLLARRVRRIHPTEVLRAE